MAGDGRPTGTPRRAVEVIRQLWQGGYQSHHGKHFTVENARLYTLPQEPPRVMVAVGGPKSTEIAAHVGDGLVSTSRKKETIDRFRAGGGEGKPCYGELTVCWANDATAARRMAKAA